ncbi:MAG: polyprenyl synthetase family protein [Candidatus Dadabacteria bacterium]|nr:MAG: polyprenyl synthetase family protein [Candidatus Dadabacteria bacterium]
MKFDIKTYLAERRMLVDGELDRLLTDGGGNGGRLLESMRYSALAGGKRLRPILAIASGEAVGADARAVLPAACAIEMIHTYSLIHDDLPSMDDDALRRGVPTNHRVFGESTAILAGDALLTDAFGILVGEGLRRGIGAQVLCDVVIDLAEAAGSRGMIEGQVIDLALAGNKDVTLGEVERMHTLKTGAMIRASVTAGARIGGADESQLGRLSAYAEAIGLAFQIIDDILDIEGEGDLGKERGNDERHGKSTYPGVAGIDESRKKASELTRQAVRALEGFDHRAEALRQIALWLGCRNN